MTLKESIQIEAKAYAFGDQNEERTFLAGSDFAIKAVIEMLEREKRTYLAIGHDCTANLIEDIINLLKSEV